MTIRAGIVGEDLDFEYRHLHLHARNREASAVAADLRAARIDANAAFTPVPASAGQAYWLTGSTVYGMTAPVVQPSFYYSTVLQTDDSNAVALAHLDDPAFGQSQPYYPRAEDALLEVLYGVTRHQSKRDMYEQLVVHIPYAAARIARAEYVDDAGLAVELEGEAVAGHRLEVVYVLDVSEYRFRRRALELEGAGIVHLPLEGAPSYFALSLLNGSGELVDAHETYLERSGPALVAVGPEALPEAIDFLAAVWRNAFGRRLLDLHRLTPAAMLSLPVSTRGDFESRMSDLADVLDAIEVHDDLLPQGQLPGLRSLGRMKVVLESKLEQPHREAAVRGVRVLQDAVRLRVAFEHRGAEPDFATMLAKFGIATEGDWAQAWQSVRAQVVAGLKAVRTALSSLD